jgi:uncharacterized membrane protein
MTIRVQELWERLRSSLWFLPSVMTVAAILLAFGTIWIDRTALTNELGPGLWLYTGGADGAREMLSTIASSIIGVAGIAFSVTIVALSLAATQLGPRLLRNFMRDTGNQVVLGTFIATFIFCVLVLRTVRDLDHREFVPNISITVAVALSLASLGVLIYFIHHVSVLMQAPNVIATVAAELHAAIARLFPERIARSASAVDAVERVMPAAFDGEAVPIPSPATGYLQVIDADRVLKLAVTHDLVLKLERRPGQFVVRGDAVARAIPRDCVPLDAARKFAKALTIGSQRTPTQDAEFAVNQLVEVAVRALSPGINDPFTAINCVDRLGGALVSLAGRDVPSPSRYDEDGRLRVISDPVTPAGIVDAAFDQVRQAARSNAAVTIRLLETIATVAPRVRNGEFRAALMRQLTAIVNASRMALPDEIDRRDVAERGMEAEKALRERPVDAR